MTRVHLRWMIRRDLPEVLEIEREAFEFPWTEEDFVGCLKQSNCIGMVADHGERVVGFMLYELEIRSIYVTTFAVGRVWRRQGVGRQLVEKLRSKLTTANRSRIHLVVRERNLAAQCFWRANGFRAVEVVRDHYEDSPEDGYRFEFRAASDELAAGDKNTSPKPVGRFTNRLAGRFTEDGDVGFE